MKKYVLFQYNQYYPSGGPYDIQGSYDTIEEAEKVVNLATYRSDTNLIVDRDTWEIVRDI